MKKIQGKSILVRVSEGSSYRESTVFLWEDTSLLAKKSSDEYLWSKAKTFNAVRYEDYYFPKRQFKLFTCNSLFHLVYLVFSTRLVANMFGVAVLGDVVSLN